MEISTQLAKLHDDFSLFSKDDFLITTGNIINSLKMFDEFSYLYNFYKIYGSNFLNKIPTSVNVKEAKNRDLPFIGKNVISNQRADFIFYFEGSLSKEDKLSITVLSHLWLTFDEKVINTFCGKNLWWTVANFKNIRDRLNLSKKVISNSYITDAIRFDRSQNEKNTKLAYEEILLLKPKLVICIGTKAKETIGMKFLVQNTKFHYIKFPKYHNDTNIYKELNKILENLC